ncbi:ribulose-phosphate 3-epimerase [Lacicoccus alkaliphilus]|uniref:Ribulose-phosphate 3-epimerase n=1 Tax=Lacicoccus alkaliphilus DSM 16010 TaxID=1123231 RepID=A0A1M7CBG6_9BACL|nr:ribulose-phosphate 3-epimerase [Salinicoccus alkaliphilus]SHL64612.1 ribulose-phosphate 3-epimerase [Salinicoccus alkaliphilus DSM 16010]
MNKVLPSLLASDFSKLGEEIKTMEEAGADIFHLDIMDGQFVPNISYGLPVTEAISKASSIPLDVHLMTLNPDQFIDEFKDMGVAMLSFHIEASDHPHRVVQLIKSKGMKAGIALNPHTPVSAVQHLLGDVDFILIMTVNPGFGGQSFIEEGLVKIGELNTIRTEKGLSFDIEVDGGINDETASLCKAEGANLLVSGSFLFKAEDKKATIEELRK